MTRARLQMHLEPRWAENHEFDHPLFPVSMGVQEQIPCITLHHPLHHKGITCNYVYHVYPDCKLLRAGSDPPILCYSTKYCGSSLPTDLAFMDLSIHRRPARASEDLPDVTRPVCVGNFWLHPGGVLRHEEAACSLPVPQKTS